MNSKEYTILQNLMKNFVKDWYFGNLSREEAQQSIFLESDGTYLIRDCNQIPGSYVLMVKEKSHTNKYVISPVGDNWKIGNSEFDSIESILTHFSKFTIRQSCLTNPAPKHFYRVMMNYNATNDLELQVNEGDFVQFVLKHDDKVLCQDQTRNRQIGWLPVTILKQPSNDATSVQQVVFKIQNMIPFKTVAIKSRNPNVFDKSQLFLRAGDSLTINVVLEDGMLKARKEDGKEGFVPFNIVRLPDFKLGI